MGGFGKKSFEKRCNKTAGALSTTSSPHHCSSFQLIGAYANTSGRARVNEGAPGVMARR
jgi:hypothetical protein